MVLMAPLKYLSSLISWRFAGAIVPLSDLKLTHPIIRNDFLNADHSTMSAPYEHGT